ncbi:MAG: phosphoglycerate kinase, partial [Candidatus Pacebacteria bacterium]|nr:phosphoglycerate kinase [Candidatus Paceibacterota bacterium]
MNLNNFSINKAKIKKGNVVILRADFNVDVVGNKITDTFRIDQTLPTISYLVKKGAKVFIIAHIGDDGKSSLKPIHAYLTKKIKTEFITNFDFELDFDNLASKFADAKPGSVMLLENIRKLDGEKIGDRKTRDALAKNFASIADIYINDAFSVSHRDHMSFTSLPKYLPSYFGLSFINEVANLSKALTPKHPMLFLLGGFKFGTKIPVLKKFTKIADKYFVGGALANNYILAEGYNV